MQWSNQQDEALQRVADWIRFGDEQVFCLQGYAGTGKTTLAKHLASGVTGQVLFGAFTGKAAHVLKQKGCPDAMTIHQMIYNPKDKSRLKLLDLQGKLDQLQGAAPEGEPVDPVAQAKLEQLIQAEESRLDKPVFALNDASPVQDASLVIIDERYMMNEKMGQDLASFGCKILLLGDPAQLPPVFGDPFLANQSDYLLTEIHRQALDNPIIRMATMVRQGKTLPLGNYGDSLVIDDRPEIEHVLAADQLIVGKNVTRKSKNDRMRTLLGYTNGPFPQAGEKLLCLRNDRDSGLLNGSLWFVKKIIGTGYETITLDIVDELGNPLQVTAHTHHFEGRADKLSYWMRREAQEFEYGYAMTCHKSQGSQWDNVFIFDESGVFRQHAKNWLYTAITRASQKVTVCRS